ncbi:MAG: molecular chaperone HtpG [Betaproteobacteria bacterium]|nr:molecular chaperone HtpG [Betaproteobacteria bacterium]
MSETVASETMGFQAEVRQLLRLMIHSLYSNKEIFLRELVSNASDAADKLRFEALADNALYESDPDLAIRISIDKSARTLSIADNGIGMSREEAVANLGTIARSGTREFLASLSGDQQKDARLIGQFGVGFYSSFIVADRVTVTTRRAGLPAEAGVRWESEGSGDYTLEPVTRAARGTEIVLHLREGEDDFLEAWTLKSVVRKYSDHISLPIVLAGAAAVDPVSKEPMPGKDETINQASALWSRPRSEVTEEQYKEFYKHVAHDFEDPLAWAHARVEGRQEYTQLLYVPSRAPFDLWERQGRHGVRLYVRRVFIMEDSDKLMPGYLRFVRGVIDADDLPLNVSREILQQSKDIEAIRAGATRRVLSMLEDLAANQAEKYAQFWSEFGRVLKEGVSEDPGNRDKIAALLRFSTTRDEGAGAQVSLADYIARMKPGQDKIYYVTAETLAAAKSSPHLEVFRRKGIEVLLLADRIDEWLVAGLPEFEGKALVSVARGGLDLGELGDEAEKKAAEEKGREFGEFTQRVKEALGERVKDVRVTLRLTDSPACLVADEHDMGGNLARILNAAGQKVPESRPILEINPAHALVLRMREEQEMFGEWAALLFEQAALAEGGELEDPAGFVQRMNRVLLKLAG